ncbi:phiSA1p31-related protein [Streptomyces sp. NBC_00649]|uniref:phiSA1p31-related protein n=1 Tax=Streptomyces sp. NBC_00649 TaxID=2975798 RepID=UPI00325006B0
MTEPHMIDLGRQVLVVTVGCDGSKQVRTSLCAHEAARLLRCAAEQLAAGHPPHPCSPGAEPDPQHERPREDEAANPRGGRLDRERKVYVDPRGHVWDLSLAWGDIVDRAWKWHGSTDGLGEPILRAVEDEDGEALPLGILRAVYGPLAPIVGAA